MTNPDKRRPLPALVFILALTLLTALVWFRVLHRSGGTQQGATSACPTAEPSSPTVLPVPSKITLVVLNSTPRAGIATAARTKLVRLGFKVPQRAANDAPLYGGHGPIPGVAEIRYGPPAAPGATLLSYYLPRAKMVPTDGPSSTVTVSLGAKYRAISTAAVVRAALARQHITLTASPAPITPTASPTC